VIDKCYESFKPEPRELPKGPLFEWEYVPVRQNGESIELHTTGRMRNMILELSVLNVLYIVLSISSPDWIRASCNDVMVYNMGDSGDKWYVARKRYTKRLRYGNDMHLYLELRKR